MFISLKIWKLQTPGGTLLGAHLVPSCNCTGPELKQLRPGVMSAKGYCFRWLGDHPIIRNSMIDHLMFCLQILCFWPPRVLCSKQCIVQRDAERREGQQRLGFSFAQNLGSWFCRWRHWNPRPCRGNLCMLAGAHVQPRIFSYPRTNAILIRNWVQVWMQTVRSSKSR